MGNTTKKIKTKFSTIVGYNSYIIGTINKIIKDRLIKIKKPNINDSNNKGNDKACFSIPYIKSLSERIGFNLKKITYGLFLKIVKIIYVTYLVMVKINFDGYYIGQTQTQIKKCMGEHKTVIKKGKN